MIKAEKILHKIRLICYFFFPILIVLFANIHHTNFDFRNLIGYNIVTTNANALYGKYLNGLNTFLTRWGLRDWYTAFWIYWVVPLSSWYFLTLPLLFFVDFIERDIFKIDNKILTEVFALLPYVLFFLNISQETYSYTAFTEPSAILRHFGQYSITDLSFGGIMIYLQGICPTLCTNVYGYVLTLHYVGVELMLVPVYAVIYLIKLLKGGFIKNDI